LSSATHQLSGFLDQHRRLLVLTGAGCSTGSGIPDYRDRDGAWKHRKPMTFAEFTASERARRRYWAGSLRGWPRVRDAKPSAAHSALARLEAMGRVSLVVTQNVDGLHQRAGSRRVIDLHGRLDVVECLSCGSRVGRDDVQALLLAWNPRPPVERGDRPDGDAELADPPADFRVPACPQCGGVLKPAVVFFGENVPRQRAGEALAGLDEADALLVVGSSLMVSSGYRFVCAARAVGMACAALNLGRTRADAELTLKLEADCGALLAQVVA
jgi:NAD-dependent SIR2 family protein deacetylase